uniref:Uncharacterized protein n=1 Tax=Oryza meridionalis TaxID=40149 RepID=A0A0E0EE38_9ORYZ
MGGPDLGGWETTGGWRRLFVHSELMLGGSGAREGTTAVGLEPVGMEVAKEAAAGSSLAAAGAGSSFVPVFPSFSSTAQTVGGAMGIISGRCDRLPPRRRDELLPAEGDKISGVKLLPAEGDKIGGVKLSPLSTGEIEPPPPLLARIRPHSRQICAGTTRARRRRRPQWWQ